MRKLVLGILALISVQFAFVTYMMVLQSPTQLANAPVQIEPRPVNPDPVRVPETAIPPEILPEREVAASRLEPRHTLPQRHVSSLPEQAARVNNTYTTRVSMPAFERVPSGPAFQPAPPRASAPVAFENVVIRYDRNAATSDCETREIPKAKKRSYLAKASPVVKKPWEWIKAIGSKLN